MARLFFYFAMIVAAVPAAALALLIIVVPAQDTLGLSVGVVGILGLLANLAFRLASLVDSSTSSAHRVKLVDAGEFLVLSLIAFLAVAAIRTGLILLPQNEQWQPMVKSEFAKPIGEISAIVAMLTAGASIALAFRGIWRLMDVVVDRIFHPPEE
jgi:hypothetical protein